MLNLTQIDFKCIDVNSKYYDTIVKLRYHILFEPFGRKISDFKSDMDVDKYSYHAAAVFDDKVIGYCRLTSQHSKAQISRVFVIDEFTKKGVGQKLIKTILKIGSDAGIKEVYLNSRIEAIGFYKKLGFEIKGKEFISEQSGLGLVKMGKSML